MKSLSIGRRLGLEVLAVCLMAASMAALPAAADAEAGGAGSSSDPAVADSGPELGPVTGIHLETTEEGYTTVVTDFTNGRRYEVIMRPNLGRMRRHSAAARTASLSTHRTAYGSLSPEDQRKGHLLFELGMHVQQLGLGRPRAE